MSRTKFIAMMRAFHAHVFQILWPRLARARLISFTDFPSTGRPLFYHRGHAPKASADVGGKQPEIKAKFWRPLRIRRTSRLGQFAVQAFHEPENARLDSEGLTRFRFMVPMHAEKNRKGALHEPASGAGVPPAAGASRPSIRRERDARAGSRDGCPTADRPVPQTAHCVLRIGSSSKMHLPNKPAGPFPQRLIQVFANGARTAMSAWFNHFAKIPRGQGCPRSLNQPCLSPVRREFTSCYF